MGVEHVIVVMFTALQMVPFPRLQLLLCIGESIAIYVHILYHVVKIKAIYTSE